MIFQPVIFDFFLCRSPELNSNRAVNSPFGVNATPMLSSSSSTTQPAPLQIDPQYDTESAVIVTPLPQVAAADYENMTIPK